MAEIELTGVTKRFDKAGVPAVDSLDLLVEDGELMVLVGPSGCGKTTALRMIAGLDDVTEGTIRIGDSIVNDVPATHRDIAMVFQNYALYPHMTAVENMAFGLRLRKMKKDEIARRVRSAAVTLDLEEYLERKPKSLSGGQRQRVAMGRAIVREPQAFLMDEPLSNLDANLRVQMRSEIAKLQTKLGVTTVYVTHDQVEAMTMGHRIAILKRGVLQQVGSPQEVYEHPANVFVACFIGAPAMNLVEGCLEEGIDGLLVTIGDTKLPLDNRQDDRLGALRKYVGGKVGVGVRPEDIEDADLVHGEKPPLISVVPDFKEWLGSDVLLHFSVGAPPIFTDDTKALAEEGDPERARLFDEHARNAKAPFVARINPRTRANAGEKVHLVIHTVRMHFFDLQSGLAIAN